MRPSPTSGLGAAWLLCASARWSVGRALQLLCTSPLGHTHVRLIELGFNPINLPAVPRQGPPFHRPLSAAWCLGEVDWPSSGGGSAGLRSV
jgi:hypothetical protein